MSTLVDLNNKFVTPDRIAEIALDDPLLLQDLLAGIGPQTQKLTRRENCSQALMFMAETWPETLLPHWTYFIQLFKCNNGFSKYVAIYVITSLIKNAPSVDITKDLDDYFDLLDDDSVMVASHAALNAAKIAEACPSLHHEVVCRLLAIDQTHHDSGHLALVKAYIIEAFDKLYPDSDLKAKILGFVTQQLESESAKTRKLAKIFIKRSLPIKRA